MADQSAEITKHAVGLDLKFHFRVELGGPQPPSDDVVAKINQILKEVADTLKLE